MKANVLVTAAGSIVAQGIIKSLKLARSTGKLRYNIISTDMNPTAAGLYRSDVGRIVPPSSSPEYIDAIIKTCQWFNVDAVFCGSDDELLCLSTARRRIEEESGSKVLVGRADAVAIARDKWKTFEFCKANDIPCAPSCLPADCESFIVEYGFPVVVKPREGYGSVHVYLAKDCEELDRAISTITKTGWHPIVQKHLKGELEFTSGVTVDKNAKYVMSSISIRKIIKNGQTHKAFIDNYADVRKNAETTALRLGSAGAVNVQVKVEGEPQVIEINPRFSATCPMRAVAGVNEPDLVFRNHVLGEEIKIDSYTRLFCARYLNEVYVPLDAYEKAFHDPELVISHTKSFIPDYF